MVGENQSLMPTTKESNTPWETALVRSIEVARIVLCASGVGLGYSGLYTEFSACVVFSLAGITAIESLLMGELSARDKGWPVGSPYQAQGGLNLLATTVVYAVLLGVGSGDAALAALTAAVVGFIVASGGNHVVQELRARAKGEDAHSIHYCRAFGSLALAAAAIPVLVFWGALG